MFKCDSFFFTWFFETRLFTQFIRWCSLMWLICFHFCTSQFCYFHMIHLFPHFETWFNYLSDGFIIQMIHLFPHLIPLSSHHLLEPFDSFILTCSSSKFVCVHGDLSPVTFRHDSSIFTICSFHVNFFTWFCSLEMFHDSFSFIFIFHITCLFSRVHLLDWFIYTFSISFQLFSFLFMILRLRIMFRCLMFKQKLFFVVDSTVVKKKNPIKKFLSAPEQNLC